MAVVTGASSGIGRAIAERLGAAGAHVYLAGRSESAMQASKERIESNVGRATIATGDLRDPGILKLRVHNLSMPLDGFIAGPEGRLDNPAWN